MTDWNMILFVIRWVAIGLFYAVLLLLVFGVYREMSRGGRRTTARRSIANGRLRVIAAGDDPQLRVGSVLTLRTETRLGAERDNDILLRDAFVSGHHACLRWDGTTWWVEDLNSKNGTMVNHQTCVIGSAYPLPMGSILSIGDITFQLIDPDAV